MNLPKPPSKPVFLKPLKVATTAEQVKSKIPATSAGIGLMLSESLLGQAINFNKNHSKTCGVEVKSVEITRQIKVEIARPTLGMAEKFDSLSLLESLIATVKNIYPLLIREVSSSSAEEYFLGEKPSKNPVKYRVQLMLKVADKLFKAQDWKYIPDIEAYQAPLFMGDGLMIGKEELTERFEALAQSFLREQKLLK